jgi:hypothetical protein
MRQNFIDSGGNVYVPDASQNLQTIHQHLTPSGIKTIIIQAHENLGL